MNRMSTEPKEFGNLMKIWEQNLEFNRLGSMRGLKWNSAVVCMVMLKVKLMEAWMMKMRTLVISLAALLVVLVSLMACGSESAAAPAQIMQDSANDDNLREELGLEKGFGLTSSQGSQARPQAPAAPAPAAPAAPARQPTAAPVAARWRWKS